MLETGLTNLFLGAEFAVRSPKKAKEPPRNRDVTRGNVEGGISGIVEVYERDLVMIERKGCHMTLGWIPRGRASQQSGE